MRHHLRFFWALLPVLGGAGCAGDAPELASDAAAAAPDAPGDEARIYFVDGEGREVARLRYGEPFAVRVDGLVPGTEVTIRSSFWGYQGEATFLAGAAGRVDTSIDAPSTGSYEGVEPEGLLWSMSRISDETGETLDLHVSAAAGGVSLEATLERAWLNEGLESLAITDGGLFAELFKPAGTTGRLPALLVMGGSEGGIDSAAFQAAWLAGYGYVALALAYFDATGLPAELREIPLEYFGTAIDLLAARDDVDPARIGVVGASRGGELVLMLGERYPSVAAVVAQVPSGVRWGAVSDADAAAWSWDGSPLPYLGDQTGAQPEIETLPGGGTGYRFTPVFEAALDDASPQELAAATIAVEQTGGPVLLLAGADDALWPSCRLAEIAMDRLIASGHGAQHRDELRCFPDAGHFVPDPGWPTAETYAIDMGGWHMILGGTPAGTAHAQREGLAVMRAFLDAELKE